MASYITNCALFSFLTVTRLLGCWAIARFVTKQESRLGAGEDILGEAQAPVAVDCESSRPELHRNRLFAGAERCGPFDVHFPKGQGSRTRN